MTVSSSGSAGRSADDIARRQREKAERLIRQAGNYEKGAAAERHVAEVLDTLPGDYYVLHDLNVPGSKANVDHLVIGPSGVWAIDTKAYAGELKAGQDMLWRGRIPIRKECETAQWESAQIAESLGVPVRTALCFVGTVLPAPVTYLGDVAVCPSEVVTALLLSVPPTQDSAASFELFERACSLVRDPSTIRRPQSPYAAPPTGWSQQGGVVAPEFPRAPKSRTPAKPSGGGQKKAAGSSRSDPPWWLPLLKVVAVGVVVVGLLTQTPRIGNWLAQRFADSTESLIPTTTTAPTGSGSVAATNPANATDSWPTVTLTCPGVGQHWTASVTASTDAPDAVGFFVWYRLTEGGPWFKWGHFIPGTAPVYDLGNIQPGTVFSVRFDRSDLEDGANAAGVVELSTGMDC